MIALAFTFMSVSLALAAGSPSIKPRTSKDIEIYNDGVELMLAKKFSMAEKYVRKALALNDSFVEAHNNLAYTLRKQVTDYYDEALKHDTRLIELNPGLDQPYVYHGVLYIQMGKKNLALADHQTPVNRNSSLPSELQFVVENGREKEPEQFFWVSRRIDA